MRHPVPAALMNQVQGMLDQRKPPTAERPGILAQVRDESGGTHTELAIYDEIGFFGIMAADVTAALAGAEGDLHVRVNSPGGDVLDGVAIYNALADYDGQVTVTVDGLAASAASFIAMAGDRVVMNRASQMMIHDAIGMVYGNAADMTGMATLLEKISDTIAGIYADRAPGDAADWRGHMRTETWYTADEAVDAGLADAVTPKTRKTSDRATAAFDLSMFRYPGRAAAPAPIAVADKALAVHHTATDNSTWDGPGAEAAMPAEAATLKYCHAWENSDGDPDAKGSYRFPHHRHEGGPANLAACRNGLARLSGAHIPDGDRAGVEAHLRAHLADAGDNGDDGGPTDHLHFDDADLAGYDPAVMKAALATAADGFTFEPDTFRSAVAKAAGFNFDGDVFKAALELHAGNAPAAPPREEPAPPQDSYDATTVTRAIREAIR